MSRIHDIVFLFDMDDTLIDNDAISTDLDAHIERIFGVDGRRLYREIYESIRDEVQYADYLGAIQRFRVQCGDEVCAQDLGAWLLEYPFVQRLYPHALAAIAHVSQFGPAVVVSDGDAILQPHKISASGVSDAVEGNVLIYVHKETMLDDVERRFPARHYVIFEDKLRVLDALKRHWGERLTTVFVQQGHYAQDPQARAEYPAAQIELARIGDVRRCNVDDFARGLPGQESASG